jgi:hypothetical protein
MNWYTVNKVIDGAERLYFGHPGMALAGVQRV